MCGIVGIVGRGPVNQSLYDALLVLQHRGQDAAGIVTCEGEKLHLRKDNGLVRDVFRTRHMMKLQGNLGLGHVRYPTAGVSSSAEAQPFYVNSPYGIVLALEFAPQALGGSEFSIDRFDVSGFLVAGANRVRVTAETLCSVYELQRLELGTGMGAVYPLEACQMTHAIAADLPTDDVTSFSPTDAQAVCWTRVASEAIGRRIEFRFYDPSGDLYFTATRTADRYNWGYIHLAGRDAAALQGRWRVDVSVGGCLCASVPFSVGSVGDAWRPRITGIEFPAEIRANGERTYGWVTFTDLDADVSWVRFLAVEGLFSGFEFDPDVGGQTAGRFSFYVYTRLAQTVRLEVVLYDHAGHASAPAYLTFRSR